MVEQGPPLELLARQAAWQRRLADLGWPEKVRWAAAIRGALEILGGRAEGPTAAPVAAQTTAGDSDRTGDLAPRMILPYHAKETEP